MNVIEAQAFVTETIENIMEESVENFDMATLMDELHDLQGSWDINVIPESELILVIETHKN